ncbi:DUF2750 domain-containing protein [Acinetobacter sp. WCHAc060033]|uniref:DUF2750 domain-containing protein n=1 Tax=Acinetobacter sp. WCHAc060033 TaxID=2518624 RepID=UPI00102344B5|nr:DUF2750 domain-containing protein [Acinetobacter sp. WCHAc060033]RZG86417.1 DUF2750 domain-containing protein [Acinetobacter sp. WCHAc060033]
MSDFIVTEQQIKAILALDGESRYRHFIKEVVGKDEIWVLGTEDSWHLVGDENEDELLPIWPAKEYVQLYADSRNILDAKPFSVSLEDFMLKHVEGLLDDNLGIAVFMTPDGAGTTPSLKQFVGDI